MAKPVYLSEELQLRMAGLDKRCNISMDRRTEYASGAGWSSIIVEGDRARSRRAWYVRITLLDGEGPNRLIHVQETSLAAALADAVGQAETRGWHLPKG